MNLRLKLSPKILTHWKKDTKPPGQRLRASSLWSTPMSLLGHELVTSSATLRVPRRFGTRGAVGSGGLTQAKP